MKRMTVERKAMNDVLFHIPNVIELTENMQLIA